MKGFLLAFLFSVSVSPWELPWMNAGSGAIYKSIEHPGVTVVENYFRTCSYCNENAPNVDELATKYADNQMVHVLDVGIDRYDRDYQAWVSAHNPNHPVIKDAQRTLTGQLGTTGYPSTYVLDCNNNVVYKSTGVWSENTKAELKNAIDQSLGICIVPL